MITNDPNKIYYTTIDDSDPDESLQGLVNRFIMTLPNCGFVNDPRQLVNVLGNIYRTQNGLEGKKVIVINPLQTVEGHPFVLTPEQQIALTMVIELTDGPELGANTDNEIINKYHCNLILNWSHDIGCGGVNYLTLIKMDLYMLIEDILQSNIPFTTYQKDNLIGMQSFLSESFFQIEGYLTTGNESLFLTGSDCLVKIFNSILQFIATLNPSHKEKINLKKIEKLMEMIQQGLKNRKEIFPLLLLPNYIGFSPENFIKSVIHISSYVRTHINHVSIRLNMWIVEFNRTSNFNKKSLNKIKTPIDSLNKLIEKIKYKISEIVEIFKVNGKLVVFNPYYTDIKNSISDLRERIQKTEVVMEYISSEGGRCLVDSIIKISKIVEGNESFNSIKKIIESDIPLNPKNHYIVPIWWLNSLILWGNKQFAAMYSPEILKEINSLIDVIPKTSLSNFPYHTQTVCDVFVSYAYSLILDIDNGKKANGKFFNNPHIKKVLNILSYTININSIKRNKDYFESTINHWRESSLDESFQFIEMNAKDLLTEALKDKKNPDADKMIIYKKSMLLLKIIRTVEKFVVNYSNFPNENPLVLLSNSIPETHMNKDKLPSCVMAIADQMTPMIKMILVEIENTKKIFDKIFNLDLADKEKKSLNDLFLEGRKNLNILHSLSLNTLQTLPKSIDSLSTLKIASITLNKFLNSFILLSVDTDKTSAEYIESQFVKNCTLFTAFQPLFLVNNILSSWISEYDLLIDVNKKKIQNKILGSLIELEEENNEDISEDLIDTHIESSSIQIELPIKDITPVIPIKKAVNFEHKISSLLHNNTLSKEDRLTLKNIRCYLSALRNLGELKTTPWPEFLQFFLAFQLCKNIALAPEQWFKFVLSESVTGKKILEQRNSRGQMLKTIHNLGLLLDTFCKTHTQINEKQPHFCELVRSLQVNNIIDRSENLETEGLFGSILSDLKAIIKIKQSLKDNVMDEFALNYCVQQLGKDRTQWVEKLDKKKDKLVTKLRKISEKLIGYIDDITPLILTDTSSKFNSKTLSGFNPILLVPKEKAVFGKKLYPKERLKEMQKQYQILEEQLSSENLKKLLPRDGLEYCQELLDSLKALAQLDLSQYPGFVPHIASMHLDTLENLVEEILQLMLEKMDPGYLKQEYVTETQTKPLSHSHCLDLFDNRLESLMPQLKVSKEAIEEIKLLTIRSKILRHYAATEIENNLNLNLQILQDQSNICVLFDECRSDERLPDEASQWLIDRYGNNRDNWGNLKYDLTYMFQTILAVGLHSLKLVSDRLRHYTK